MPEGDTIHRTAARLSVALGDGPVASFETPRHEAGPRPEPGERIEAIDAKGKHLLIAFSGGATLHTHLRMTGSSHITAAGVTTWAASRQVRVAIGTPTARAVCLDAPVVELLDAASLRRHSILNRLGPDLCDEDVDLDAVLARAARLEPSTPIGVALLDQRVASGIGNVYRSEVLWLCRVDPFVPLGDVPVGTRQSLWRTAHEQLRHNLGPGPRRTVPEGLAVYDRAGRSCRRCGARIEVRRSGEQGRAAWWCPACQTLG
jgi:endonuclease VIII